MGRGWQPLSHGGSAPGSPGPSPQRPILSKEEKPQEGRREGRSGNRPELGLAYSQCHGSCPSFHTSLKHVGNMCIYGTVLGKSCLSHRSPSSVNARQDQLLILGNAGIETFIPCPRG